MYPSGDNIGLMRFGERKKLPTILERVRWAWEARTEFRERRKRSRNYVRGKPKESMRHPETGLIVTEEQYIAEQGRIPFRRNKIGPIVYNLKGQYRQNKTQRVLFARHQGGAQAAEMMSGALEAVSDVNQIEDIDTDQFEEAAISGLYGWKTGFKWVRDLNRPEVCIDPIDPNRIFFSADLTDRRLRNLNLIGELHDLTFDEVVEAFARTDEDEIWLRQYYSGYQQNWWGLAHRVTGFDQIDSLDFYSNGDWSKCRVYEVWVLEWAWRRFTFDASSGSYEPADVTDAEIAVLNQQRQIEAAAMGMPPEMAPLVSVDTRYEAAWRVYYMTPHGDVLAESDNPYWHEQHPYTLGFARFVDGEIWGMVEELIDDQRLINRLTTAMDYMFSASAKGVLLIDEDAIPDGWTMEMFASEWSKFNGVIKYKQAPGKKAPQQITANSIPIGLFNWLTTLNNELKEVSGVSQATMGLEPQSGTPASLYNQQVMQSSLTNKDAFEAFFSARRQRDLKVVKLIQQFYDSQRYLGSTRRRPDGQQSGVMYDPAAVRNIEFDVTITDAQDTPLTRQLFEDYMLNLMNSGRLTFPQYLQLSGHPKAEAIMAVIQRTNPLLATVQVSPESAAALEQQYIAAAQAGDLDAAAILSQTR